MTQSRERQIVGWALLCSGVVSACLNRDQTEGQGRSLDFAPPESEPDAAPVPNGGSPAVIDQGVAPDAAPVVTLPDPDEPAAVVIAPPTVVSMTPDSGPYGSSITLTGSGLGSSARQGVSLALGAAGDLILTPASPEVVSWSETEVVFRFPFPALGAVVVTTPQGSADAGSFTPDWQPGASIAVPEGAAALFSIAPAEGTLIVAFDTSPVTILGFDGADWTSNTLDATALRPGTLRFYLTDQSDLEAFALSDADPPEVRVFTRTGEDWMATASGVTVSADYALAGGPNGGVVWSRTGDDWTRARYTASGWASDKGPLTDPRPTEPNHAAGVTSDGSLFVAWDQDTGNFLDDMGAPFLQQIPEDDLAFGTTRQAGNSIDDYVTSIELRDRGRGLLVYYCGSDVDPFGLSGTDYVCATAVHTSGGITLLSGPNEGASTRYAASLNTIAVGYCDDSVGLRLTTDYANDVSAAVVWPCPQLDALEIDPSGALLAAIRHGSLLYSPRPTE